MGISISLVYVGSGFFLPARMGFLFGPLMGRQGVLSLVWLFFPFVFCSCFGGYMVLWVGYRRRDRRRGDNLPQPDYNLPTCRCGPSS